MFRNTIGAIFGTLFSVISGVFTFVQQAEPLVGLMVAIIGALAGWATWRAQSSKRMTETLRQRQIRLEIKKLQGQINTNTNEIAGDN